MPFSGDKLRELRESANLDREQLADQAKTTKQYIAHLENGVKTNPAFDLVERLARALGVDCTAFAGNETIQAPSDPISAPAKPAKGRKKK